jgi:hypothetical protein
LCSFEIVQSKIDNRVSSVFSSSSFSSSISKLKPEVESDSPVFDSKLKSKSSFLSFDTSSLKEITFSVIEVSKLIKLS